MRCSYLRYSRPYYAVYHAFTGQAIGKTTRKAAGGEPLVTTSYVLLETCALVQRRLGIDVLRRFCEEIVPILDVEWVGQDQHEAAVTALLAAGRKGLSLVDCVSFSAMRRNGIKDVFAFDPHFEEQGFNRLPD